MHIPEFEHLISKALEDLPPSIQKMLDNVEVIARNFPTREQLQANSLSSRMDLLGLYEGVPLTERTASYGMVLPDRITIFRGPIEAICGTRGSMAEQVRTTVKHEVAHHFGISDERLDEMGRY